jgi:hypothetical protein
MKDTQALVLIREADQPPFRLKRAVMPVISVGVLRVKNDRKASDRWPAILPEPEVEAGSRRVISGRPMTGLFPAWQLQLMEPPGKHDVVRTPAPGYRHW